jgi:Flp pilus assembly pilin Flp
MKLVLEAATEFGMLAMLVLAILTPFGMFMTAVWFVIKKIFSDQEGNTMIEYALLAAFVSVCAVFASTWVGNPITTGGGASMIFYRAGHIGSCLQDYWNNGTFSSGNCNIMRGH